MNDSFQPTSPAHVRQGPDIEAGRPVLRESALEWFEREDGLPVVGFRIDSPTGLANEVDWHTHGRAQLICVESGLLTTRTRHQCTVPALAQRFCCLCFPATLPSWLRMLA